MNKPVIMAIKIQKQFSLNKEDCKENVNSEASSF